jgi:hypothetical protein
MLGYGYVRQIRLFQNLAASSGVLGEKALQFDHETGFFAQDLEDLVGRGGNAVKVVRNDIWRMQRDTRGSFSCGTLRYILLGFLLCTGRRTKQEGQSQTTNTFVQFLLIKHNFTLRPGLEPFNLVV